MINRWRRACCSARETLFRTAHRRLLAERIVLPGEQVLVRVVGSVRERATHRLWSRLAGAASPEVITALEALLVVPGFAE